MKIEVCAGSKCMVAGGDILLSVLEKFRDELILEHPKLTDQIEIISTPCDGLCYSNDHVAPVVRVDDQTFLRAKSQDVMSYIMNFYEL